MNNTERLDAGKFCLCTKEIKELATTYIKVANDPKATKKILREALKAAAVDLEWFVVLTS